MATGVPQKKKAKNKIPVYLTYVGKQNQDEIINSSFHKFDDIISINGKSDNHFFYGDNFDVLLHLINIGYRSKINLIYIDPPFATVSDFVNRNQEQAYSDSLCGGEYVEFLRKRLILMYQLLSDNGSIYLHLDNKMAFTMKIIMDEIFGDDNFRAFITRKKCSTKNYTKNTFGNVSDYIMFYTKTSKYTWNRPFDPWELDKMIEQYPCVDEKGRRYKKVPVHAPGVRNGETGKRWRGKLPPIGKHWQYTPDKLDELDAAGEIYWSPNGNPRRMVFCDPTKGIPVQDIWLNFRDSVNQAQKTTGYPTEKNFEMLKLIVKASSNPGDIVLDCFAGSGTTLGAAFECDRRWIGVDNSPQSLIAVLKRFSNSMEIYGDYVSDPIENFVQFSFEDFQDKCPFDIWCSSNSKEVVLEICNSMKG